MRFTWWQGLIFWSVVGWPVTLGIAVLLGIIGGLTRGPWRMVFWTAACGLAIFLAVMGFGMLRQKQRSIADIERFRTEQARLHVTLDQPTSVDGFLLPVGTVVQWTTAERKQFNTAELPVPIQMYGATVIGTINTTGSQDLRFYAVTLAEAATLQGWPCAAGSAEFSPNGELKTCNLHASLLWKGIALPIGTGVFRLDLAYANPTAYRFALPPDQGLHILGLEIPPSSDLSVRSDGTPLNATDPAPVDQSAHAPRLTLRGVTLDTYARFESGSSDDIPQQPSAVSGRLGLPLQCSTEILPQNTPVFIPLHDGKLRVDSYAPDGSPSHRYIDCLL